MMEFLGHLCFLRHHTFLLHLKQVLVQVPSVASRAVLDIITFILHFLSLNEFSALWIHWDSAHAVARNSGHRYFVSPHANASCPIRTSLTKHKFKNTEFKMAIGEL